ncbi:MAG: LysR family transcriptional regulator [Steroidobacteraceae bacterium]|nr:LysR family transcriptional regulator [Steroidobacteraceae bacterium]
MDRLTSILVFTKVASARSFAAAARALRMSPAVVSKHVQSVEDWVGARLLNRTTRHVSLTEAGASFYARNQRIIEDLEEARASAARGHAVPSGTLRVSAPVSFGMRHLGPILARYMSAYPNVLIDLVLDDRRVNLVEEGFDVAIRIGHLEDSSLVARRIAPSREVVCAAPSYLARRGEPKAPEELSAHDCLDYTLRSTGAVWRLAGPRGEHAVRINPRMTATSGELLRQAALAGAGIILCPTFLVGDDLAAGRLVSILTRYSPIERTLYAVYPSRRQLSAKVRSFVEHVAAEIGPQPAWDRGLPRKTLRKARTVES